MVFRHQSRRTATCTYVAGLLTLFAVVAAHVCHAADEPAAAPVNLTATATPREVTIGDSIRYVVEVSAAADTEVLIPILAGQIGEFAITDFGEVPARKEPGRVITGRWYTLNIWTTGDHIIPAPTVQYRVPGEALQEARGDEVLIGVKSLLASDPKAADIREVKPPEAVPFDWRPYGVIAAALVVAGLLVAALVYFVTRPRRQYAPPPRPAHEVAIEALQRLRAQRLIEEGRFETFYIELSAIVRRYLENGFHVHAPEMTTEEFLAVAARDDRLAAAHRRSLGGFLSEADLVKFARHHPTPRDSEAAYDAARRFVDETRPSTAPSPEVHHAAA